MLRELMDHTVFVADVLTHSVAHIFKKTTYENAFKRLCHQRTRLPNLVRSIRHDAHFIFMLSNNNLTQPKISYYTIDFRRALIRKANAN